MQELEADKIAAHYQDFSRRVVGAQVYLATDQTP
jgi:hypothetical protein